MTNFETLFNSEVKFPVVCKLPFLQYDANWNTFVEEKEVEVVYACKGRLKVIICRFGSEFQDYYYNNGFKLLSEDCMTMGRSWIEEEVGVKCPKEFSKVVPCMIIP